MIRKNIAFIITSVINPVLTDYNTYIKRTIYSAEERFEQTLETIRSIREKIPGVTIYLIEGSPITTIMESRLVSLVDHYINTADDPAIRAAVDGRFKGVGEAAKLYHMINIIENLDYDYIFKISGRYFLGPNFQLENFFHENPTMCSSGKMNVATGPYTTALFCIPRNKLPLFKIACKKLIDESESFYDGKPYPCIEITMTISLAPVNVIPYCGLKGPISDGAYFYDCSVEGDASLN
jgi:hypothetical protein